PRRSRCSAAQQADRSQQRHMATPRAFPPARLFEHLAYQAAQYRSDTARECWVGIRCPGNGRRGIERRIQLSARRSFNHTTRLAKDQLRADVVRMTRQLSREPELTKHQRTNISDEPVVAGQNFRQLATGRDVLIVEYMCDGLRFEFGPETLLELAGERAPEREKLRDRGEAVRNGTDTGKARTQRLTFAVSDVDG